MGRDTRYSVFLVQQGVWDMPLESMPLASGYLKSTAAADDRVDAAFELKIRNYRGGVKLPAMAHDLFRDGAPDILACSVLGWNQRAFGALAETFKQLNPDGWVIFGGTHVAEQADRVFGMFGEVDIVVNGEGELVFRDLLNAYLDGRSPRELADVTGISYRDGAGNTRTTDPRDRIDDLDIIPSPTLTGAFDLTDEDGRFRYDVALMETNRGCPYKCSFCYWGGAIGQRVRAFSRERLRAELEVFAQLKVHAIALCDANFGLLPIDEEFVDDLLEIRERYGYPRALESSWAKNKSKVFYNIVHKMREAGLRSSFTLSLQSLSDPVLQDMQRKNMKLNEWEDLVGWLNKEGLDCYGELIWGAPGETIPSFMEGYDRLAEKVSRIAVYPLLLLPNTEYLNKKKEHGIVSVRGEQDDFEYVLAHNTMSFADNQRMQRFLFWSRVVAECSVIRHSFVALRELGGVKQSEVLVDIDAWIARTDDPAAAPLRDAVAIGFQSPGSAIAYLYVDPAARRLLRRWWAESIRPRLPADVAPVLDEVFRYDLLTKPIVGGDDAEGPAEEIALIEVDGHKYQRRTGLELAYDVPEILRALRRGDEPDLTPRRTPIELYYRTGVEDFANTTNSEEIIYFLGMEREELLATLGDEDGHGYEPYKKLIQESGGCA